MPLADYVLHEKLGEGTFGVVRRATHTPSGRVCAIKKIKTDCDDEGISGTTLREVSALKEIVHPNIIGIYEVVIDENNVSIVMPYCQIDLRKAISNGISAQETRTYARHLCTGVAEMHRHRWMHRDLKPQNILIQDGATLRIADLGLNRAFQVPMRPYTLEVMTRWYRCPELFLGAKTYGCEVDMWSVGCILGEMCSESAMFPGDSDIDTLFRIFRLLGTPTPETWADVATLPHYKPVFPKYERKDLAALFSKIGSSGVALLSMLLEYIPARRISAFDALASDYLIETP